MGTDRGVRNWAGGSRRGLILWLKGIDPAPSEFIRRVLLARRLNEVMNCSVFTAWNIGGIPGMDLRELDAWTTWSKELSDG